MSKEPTAQGLADDLAIARMGIGIGDIVYFFTYVTGVAWLVGRLARGKSCGCQGRRSRWNVYRLMWPIQVARSIRARPDGSFIRPKNWR